MQNAESAENARLCCRVCFVLTYCAEHRVRQALEPAQGRDRDSKVKWCYSNQ